MYSKIVVCFLIIFQLNIIWCKPLAQYRFTNQSMNAAEKANWQNNPYRDANSYGLDLITTTTSTSKPLYPTLHPKYQPNMSPWNNNYHPQLPYDNDSQRSVNPAVYPLQPDLDNNSNANNNNHQATIPPFKDNGYYNNPGAGYNNIRPQITSTRPATVPVTGPAVSPYSRTLPTNRPGSNYNNNYYYNNNDDRYNGGVHPNSQFNNSRNYNPQYPYRGGMNANTNGNRTGNIYNYRPQPYDNRPQQPNNQNSNIQRPIDPYLGNNNIAQSTYNTPSNNNNRQLPNNEQSNFNIGQSPYSGLNGNGTGNIYNYRPQPYDNRPRQQYNQNSNVQHPIDPYLGNNNIGQSTYNTPTNNNNRQLPNNDQSNFNIGQSPYIGPSNFNPFNNNNNNDNNMQSDRNSFEPSAPSNNNVKNNGPSLPPDYDPSGIALAPFPGEDRLFNSQNVYGRQQPSKYNSPSGLHNTGTLHVPLAPFPAR